VLDQLLQNCITITKYKLLIQLTKVIKIQNTTEFILHVRAENNLNIADVANSVHTAFCYFFAEEMAQLGHNAVLGDWLKSNNSVTCISIT